MIKILEFSEIDTHQWQKLVVDSSTATFFQTKECYDFYCSLSFLKPFLFGVAEDEKLVGLVCGYIIADGGKVKQFFSKRAIVPSGLLLDDQISENALNLLLAELKNTLSRSAIYIEIRNYNDYSSFRTWIESNGFEYQAHLNFHVETLNVDVAMKALSSSKRRQIKLSLKAGAKIEMASTKMEVQAYYDILQNLYKTKVKSPLFPLEFFEKIIELETAKLLLVVFNEKVIGGITCVLLNEKTVSEWFVCGDDTVDKNVYTSVLATWAGIEYASINNFEKFDFMGAGKPDQDYGVREFKSKFGGELVEHGRFLYVSNSMLYTIGQTAIKFLKKQ